MADKDKRRDVKGARVRAVDPGLRVVVHEEARPGGRVPMWALVMGAQSQDITPVAGVQLYELRADLVEALSKLGFAVDAQGFLRVKASEI